MACRDGFSAQFSQYSDSVRRSILYNVPEVVRSNSLLKNLNTTCTIKSAPPRTPDVMTELSTKSGWLIKRNEQNVWQKRWCCVVPHTFLYYYDEGAIEIHDDDDDEDDGEHFRTDMQPAGIIDLEPYTTTKRSKDGSFFELKGDPNTNPQLRSFYFKAKSRNDVDRWSNALLNDRYSNVMDELEAYQQVSEGAKRQVIQWRDIADNAQSKTEISEMVTKNVRAAAEKNRQDVNSIVRTTLEQGLESSKRFGTGQPQHDLTSTCAHYISQLDTIERDSNSRLKGTNNIVSSVELLADFTTLILKENEELRAKMEKMAEQNVNSQTRDDKNTIAQVESLRAEIMGLNVENENKKKLYMTKNLEHAMQSLAAKEKIEAISTQNENLQRELSEVQSKENVDKTYKPVQEYEKQIKTEKEKNAEFKQKIKGLNQRVKLQASIIDCMMNNQGKGKKENKKNRDELSDEAYFEDESIFGVVSEWTEDVSGLFQRSITSSLPSSKSPKPKKKDISPERRKEKKNEFEVNLRKTRYNADNNNGVIVIPPSPPPTSTDISTQWGFNRRVSSLDI